MTYHVFRQFSCFKNKAESICIFFDYFGTTALLFCRHYDLIKGLKFFMDPAMKSFEA